MPATMSNQKASPKNASSTPASQQPPAKLTSNTNGATSYGTTKISVTERVAMSRNLGLWNGVSIIVGVIVGSGIFVSPQGVLKEAGSVGAALCVWCACGLLALLGALCFAELGTSVAASGGEYTYITMAYGELTGFLFLWVLVVVITPCGNAISALTFSNYCLQPFFIDCDPPQESVRLLSLALLLLLVYINCVSVKLSIKLQNSFTFGKVLALAFIIAFGVYYILGGHTAALSGKHGSIWEGTQTSVGHLAQAFYAGFYTYSGW